MAELSLEKDRINFLLLEGIHPQARQLLERAGYRSIRQLPHSLDGQELADALADVHFLGIRSRSHLTEAVLEQAPRLAGVGCFCIGTNQVDLQAAQCAGVPVFNAPFSNTRSVAELVLAEIVMLMRGIPARNAAAHRGQWLKSASGSHEIRGKTLGIVGYGHIGTQLGVLAESLGMLVRFHDVEEKLPLGNAARAESLRSLLAESQIVSLHVPQTPETENLIGAVELAAMPRGGLLINASRGNVVDIDALAKALESGQIGGAAVDVFPAEPQSNTEEFVSPLRGLDQVILTPHIGGSTHEAQENIAIEVASKMVKYSDNGSTMSAVNFPEVSLPDLAGRRRIMHTHENIPGVLRALNQIFASHEVNVAAQYLQTREHVGYVVMDIETDEPEGMLDELRDVPGTIRTRVLY